MTKTTEELRREMYGFIGEVKKVVDGQGVPRISMPLLESALEEYLERLRLEALALQMRNDQQRKIIEEAGGTNDLCHRLIKMTDERDQLRNKLQAFEFANKSAGEMLQAANEKVKRQRQSIGQLKNERNNAQSLAAVNYEKYQKARRALSELRKAICSTSAQSNGEKFLCATCGDSGIVLGVSQAGGLAFGMNCPACRPAMRVEI